MCFISPPTSLLAMDPAHCSLLGSSLVAGDVVLNQGCGTEDSEVPNCKRSVDQQALGQGHQGCFDCSSASGLSLSLSLFGSGCAK
jgi:hypothetical protein